MGYKLCGCDVIGDLEIDPLMNKVYVENHKPKYNYVEDIRDFNKRDDLPEELYNLDILDGSFPCSSFAMCGDREKGWGVKKKFKEGQKEQTLDDLAFVFIETVAKLKPKVVISENVDGLIKGNAWKYVQEIYKKFHEIGYQVKHWLVKGEKMGVPQTRHRVFFVATRLPFNLNYINMYFNYEPITYGEIKSKNEKIAKGKMADAIRQRFPNEKINETMMRIYGLNSGITHRIAFNNKVFPTQIGGHDDIWTENGNHPSIEDVVSSQTFPQDYNFLDQKCEYICGMSVPPVMMKRVVNRLIESGLFDYKLGG
jgi:DNA (cytosine-5)-methyltransferase 1